MFGQHNYSGQLTSYHYLIFEAVDFFIDQDSPLGKAHSLDPDQTVPPQSDLCQHYIPSLICPNAYSNYETCTCKWFDQMIRTFSLVIVLVMRSLYIQSTLIIRSQRDPLKNFEISLLRHIRFAELRKIPIELPNFTNEHVI